MWGQEGRETLRFCQLSRIFGEQFFPVPAHGVDSGARKPGAACKACGAACPFLPPPIPYRALCRSSWASDLAKCNWSESLYVCEKFKQVAPSF